MECAGHKVPIALFGGGNMGMMHMRNALRHLGASVAYVVVKSSATCVKFAAEFPTLRPEQILTADLEDRVFLDERVRGVVISTPTFEHERLVLKALNAGKSVFCEKPIATDAAAGNRCYDLAKEKDLSLFCAFQRRFDPDFMEVRQKLQSGVVGDVQMIKVCSRDPRSPHFKGYLEHSENIFRNSTVHDFDMCCWMADECPSQLYAAAHTFDEDVAAAGDWDSVTVTLTFPSGKLAIIDQNRSAVYGYDQRLEIFGSKGMIQVANKKLTEVTIIDEVACSASLPCDSYLKRYAEAYENEMDHFVKLLKGQTATSNDGADAVRTLLLAAAAERSVHSNSVQSFTEEV